MKLAIALIDGEHYPPVVREALAKVSERLAQVAAAAAVEKEPKQLRNEAA